MDRQRIDKWLWHARMVRSRSAAAALANSGAVRVNGVKIDAASQPVKPGDVVTVALSRVRVLKVLAFAERRGSAETAAVLFQDLDPLSCAPTPKIRTSEVRTSEPRPDRRGRRAILRMKRSIADEPG